MLDHVSDETLLAELEAFVKTDTGHTARLLQHIAEVDARKAYLGRGYPSMFVYCARHLRMDEGVIYNRIHAARASRQFPVILERVANGEVHLSAVRLIAPHMTPENHAELLAAARHRSKSEIEQLLAERFPKPELPTTIRRLPEPRARESAREASPPEAAVARADASVAAARLASEPLVPATPPPPAAPPAPGSVLTLEAPRARDSHVTPVGPGRWRIQTTVSGETQARLRRVQDLLRHRVPNGDVAEVLDLALDVLEQKLLAERFAVRPARKSSSKPPAQKRAAARPPSETKTLAETKTPSETRTRHVPSETRRQVFARDGARCSFVGTGGHRCPETGFLQLDHTRPWAAGGGGDPSNVRVLCAVHNRYAAELAFGKGFMERKRRGQLAPEQGLAPQEVMKSDKSG